MTKSRRLVTSTFLTGLLLVCVWVPRASANPAAVAYLKAIIPKDAKIGDVLRVVRGGKDQSLAEPLPDLQAGDRLFVKHGAVRILILGTGQVKTIAQGDGGGSQPDFIVPEAVSQGLTGKALAFIKALMSDPDRSGTVVPVTRGSGEFCYNLTLSNEPKPFAIPVLFAERPALSAGKRALFVSWTGGRPPFDIELVDRVRNKKIAGANVKQECSARLPVVDIAPGRYRLSITDANGSVLLEDDLTVSTLPPAMPRELAKSSFPEEARQIYFATWLASLESGRWAFEAEQRVSQLDCHSVVVREWLDRWGSAPACDTPK